LPVRRKPGDRSSALIFGSALTLFRSLGVKIPKHGLALLAAAPGALELFFLPFLYGEGKGIFLIARLASEIIIGHCQGLLSYLSWFFSVEIKVFYGASASQI